MLLADLVQAVFDSIASLLLLGSLFLVLLTPLHLLLLVITREEEIVLVHLL